MKRSPDSACAVLAVGSLFPDADESLAAHIAARAPVERRGQLLRMDRLCGLSLCVADQALLGAAAANRFDPASTAVVVGSAYGCHKSDEDFFRGRLADQLSPRLFSYTLPSSPVGEVSIHHGLLGPGLSIVTGRTSGLEALAQAQDLLLARQASACLVLACEVAAPTVAMWPEDSSLRDGAVAILLGLRAEREEAGSLGQLIDSATAFRAGDAAAAALSCIEEIRQRVPLCRDATPICDPQSQALIGGAIGALQVFETPQCGAASAPAAFIGLSLLTDAQARSAASYLVLSADPAGLAAAALWRL